MSTTPQSAAVAVAGTAELYGEEYFQGGQTKSNYSDYLNEALGPSKILAETLFEFFRPSTALDVGCAVGHTVKRLRDLGSQVYGCDVSEWAVRTANVPYIKRKDFSKEVIKAQFDLVFCYDVIDLILPERLEYASKNLWNATKKDLVVVPAVFENVNLASRRDRTHRVFEPLSWWHTYFVEKIGCQYDEEATARFKNLNHATAFNYSERIMIFSKLRLARIETTEF